MLQHTVTTPRSYDRFSGTKGAFRDYPLRIYLDGQKGGEQWAMIDSDKAEYENTLWKNIGELARKRGGYGGIGFILGISGHPDRPTDVAGGYARACVYRLATLKSACPTNS
jgi:hypothetical protein